MSEFDVLGEARAAIEAGNVGHARFLLFPLTKEPTAEVLYLWARVAPNREQTLGRLRQALQLDPAHESAREELARLESPAAERVIYLCGRQAVKETYLKLFGGDSLPPLPASIMERAYRRSQRVTLLALILLLTLGLPGGALLGAIGLYLAVFVITPLALIPALFGAVMLLVVTLFLLAFARRLIFRSGLPMPPVAFDAFFLSLVVLGSVFFLGIPLGYLMVRLARLGKCRNVRVVSAVALLSTLLACAAFVIVAGRHSSAPTTLVAIGPSLSMSNRNVWLQFPVYGVLAVAGGLVGCGAILTTERRMRAVAFSERGNRWYDNRWLEARVPTEAAEGLLRALESGSTEDLPPLEHLSPYYALHLHLRMRRCSACPTCDYLLEVSVFRHQESLGEGYSPLDRLMKRLRDFWDIRTDERVWFAVLIPASLGAQLEQSLFIQPGSLPTAQSA